MLKERNSRSCRFDGRRLHHIGHIVLHMSRHALVHRCHGTITQGQSHQQTNQHLTGNLHPAVQTVLVVTESFDIVVRKTQSTQYQGGGNHEQHIDIAQTAHQQTGHQDGSQHHHAAHRRHTFFGHVKRIDLLVTLLLKKLVTLHKSNKIPADKNTDQHCQYRCQYSAERNVSHQASTRQAMKQCIELI